MPRLSFEIFGEFVMCQVIKISDRYPVERIIFVYVTVSAGIREIIGRSSGQKKLPPEFPAFGGGIERIALLGILTVKF